MKKINTFEKKMDNILSESIKSASKSLNEESESFYKKKGLEPEDFVDVLTTTLDKLKKEELGDISSWKQFDRLISFIEKDRFLPNTKIDKLKSLTQKQQMDFLQYAQFYI